MNKDLLHFFTSLDRAGFVDPEHKALAGIDRPLPIGFGQTISQPSLVAYMTDMLQLDKSHKVLEIGTGSGYQTVFLAKFSKEVYTVERIESLQIKAKERLERMGYYNIHYKYGDGSLGWGEHAPYDRIMVTAAPKVIPHNLVEQLSRPGIMILPVGPSGWQNLMLVTKDENGVVNQKKLLEVAFVELVGKDT